MLKVKLTRTTCDAYGLYDDRVVPFGGTPYITINADICLDDEKIGYMILHELNSDINLYDMMYQVPGDIGVIADQICDLNGNIKKSFNIQNKLVILDTLYIEPEYRNRGYGALAAKHLLVYLNNAYEHTIDAVVLYASMYEIEDCEEMDIETFNTQSERLVRFYERAGYTNINLGVMIKKKG